MNIETNVVIWKNTGPSGALSIHVLNTDGFNTFNYTATSSNIYIQIRQAGTYYLDNIKMYRTYQDTVFVGGFDVDMAYRYGFGGQEKDNEVSGKGNSYTAEFWQYSPRLGKRWNIDPVVKPHESPYATFANNPIWFIDPSGADTSFFDDDGNYDQQAKDDFMTAYNTVKSKIKYIENEISTIQNDIKERQEAGKRTRKQNKRLSKMQGLLEDWQKLEKDFDDIISDET